MSAETVRLRIGNLAKAVLITGQAYQDPKDALNEFVSNAADEYAEADGRDGRIRVHLRRRGRHPVVAVEDDGQTTWVAVVGPQPQTTIPESRWIPGLALAGVVSAVGVGVRRRRREVAPSTE